MTTIVSRTVHDLSEPGRQTIEAMIGSRLEPDQRVCIIVEAPLAINRRRLPERRN